MGRKKVKQELQYDEISSVTGESELDDLSIDSAELKGLSELRKFISKCNPRKRKDSLREISTNLREKRTNRA